MLVQMKLVLLIEKELSPYSLKPDELQIKRIDIVTDEMLRRSNNRDFFNGKDLSNEGRPFITKTHFRINGHFCIPAFELTPEKDENLEDFSIEFCADEGNTKVYPLTKDKNTNLFFDFPKGKYKQVYDTSKQWNGNWIFDYSSDATTGTLGVVQPGYAKILIKKNGQLYDKERDILVLPSSTRLEQLEKMIKEILFIRRELVFLNNKYIKKAKTYFGLENDDTDNFNWELQLKWIKSCLVQIEPYLKKINAMPRKNLIKYKKLQSYYQVKKITPSIIEQHVKDNSRHKYLVENDSSSLDIYEHRLLKNKLYELLLFVQEQHAQNIQNINEEENSVVNKMVQLINKDSKFSEDMKYKDINEKWIEYAKRIKRKVKAGEEKEFVSALNALEMRLINNTKILSQEMQYYYDFVIKMIKDYLKLPLFENINEKVQQPWRMTQIFTNDYNYHYVYKKLALLDKISDFSFSSNGEKILHDKVDKLYEYWVLLKIIESLVIKQKWVAANNSSDIIKLFNLVFDRKRKTNSQKVCLKHFGDEKHDSLTMDLYYDTKLDTSLSDLIKSCKNNAEALRPDFLFRIKNESTAIEKIFILDAKYRDYAQMKRDYWIKEDLKNVCAYKYIERPLNDLDIDTIATAFIVHTDMTPGNLENNTNRYQGRYVTFNAFANKKINLPLIQGKDGEKCQIGSFYLMPHVKNQFNQSEDNLNTYFAMIFEYFMGAWNTCWNCGSNSVEVEELFTAGGYYKFYMTCKNCKSFWVKNHDKCGTPIIKHLNNYHIEEKYGEPWKLCCPSCVSQRLTEQILAKEREE